MHQHSRLHVPYLHKARLERNDIRIEKGKRWRVPFPVDDPIASCPPAVAVDEEAVISVAEQELRSNTLDMDGFDVLLLLHKVERCVGLVKQRLFLERFE